MLHPSHAETACCDHCRKEAPRDSGEKAPLPDNCECRDGCCDLFLVPQTDATEVSDVQVGLTPVSSRSVLAGGPFPGLVVEDSRKVPFAAHPPGLLFSHLAALLI